MNYYYLSDRILSYLVSCSNCKTFHKDNSDNTCCICKKFYCNKCTNYLKICYGFYKNNYCKTCYDFIN